jgi:hypothetical protein
MRSVRATVATVASMTDPSAASADFPSGGELFQGSGAPIAFQYRFVADGSTAKRLAKASVRFLHTRPRVQIMYLLVGIVVFVVIFPAAVSGAVIGVLLSWLVVFGLISRAARKAAAGTAFPGAEFATGFGPVSFVTRTTQDTSEINYAAIDRIDSHLDVVFTKLRGSSRFSFLPAEVFPPDAVARVRSGQSSQ